MRNSCVARTSVLLLVVPFLLLPAQVSAEVSLDLYGGVAKTASETVTVKRTTFCTILIFLPVGPACSKIEGSREVSFDDSASLGGRIGYWGESLPWLGGALDVSHFNADGDGVNISAFPFSLLVMLRMPLLKSAEFPKGRLQPYAAAGPTFVLVDYEADFRPSFPVKVDGSAFGIGGDLRAGLAWQLYRRVALFGEFRYTAIRVDDDPGNEEGENGIETTLNTTHFLGGLSFRF